MQVRKQDIRSLPWVTTPNISNSLRSKVSALAHHLVWKVPPLQFILILCPPQVSLLQNLYFPSHSAPAKTHVEYENIEICLFSPTKFFGLNFNIFTQFLYSVLQRSPGVVNFIDNEYVLADQISVFQRGEIEPLGPSDFCARLLLGTIFRDKFLI